MSKEEAKHELAKELDEYIGKFKRYAAHAGCSSQDYNLAMNIRQKYIPMLCEFAEKYLDIKIKIHMTPVHSQYNVGEITGYEIED